MLARVHGCLVGGAIGDCLGARFEGLPADVGRQVGVGDFGGWTDDTELTVAMCRSVVRRGEVVPEDVAAAMLERWRRGPIAGLGAATLGALRGLAAGGHWALVGRTGERAAGNGAAMRVAPLGFVVDPWTLEGRRVVRDVVGITHRDDEAFAGALAVVGAVRRGLEGAWVDGLVGLLPDSHTRDRLAGLGNWTVAEAAERLGTGGWVAETVPLALVACRVALGEGPERVFRELMRVGGDTDTNAAIFGQVYGAAVGVEGFSAEWRAAVPEGEALGGLAAAFSGVVAE